ncbi:integration host factor subunit alpha [Desulfosarcina cetonica]|uniref:integration host factor subunit alpha n=1 Tax=Desulfosarcina cetonica TaxID=90730 RepID=UPI0006D174EA|nr:integration host factor subunit alpha [Desulfosarcina cetonica]
MALTKNDLVEQVAEKLDWTKNEGLDALEALLEIIKGTLSAGEDVLVSGFGKFCVKAKAERKGRNPATGTDLMLRARRVVTFKWSGQLRDRINGDGSL